MVEQEVKGRGLAGAERLDGALLDFGFETAAAQCAADATIRVEQRLGADLLRAGALDAGDQAQRDRLTVAGGISDGLEDQVLHA